MSTTVIGRAQGGAAASLPPPPTHAQSIPCGQVPLRDALSEEDTIAVLRARLSSCLAGNWGNSLNSPLPLVKIQGILFASALQILFLFRGLHLTGCLTSPQVGTRRAGSGPGVMILGWNCHSPRCTQLAAAVSAALGPGFLIPESLLSSSLRDLASI